MADADAIIVGGGLAGSECAPEMYTNRILGLWRASTAATCVVSSSVTWR